MMNARDFAAHVGCVVALAATPAIAQFETQISDGRQAGWVYRDSDGDFTQPLRSTNVARTWNEANLYAIRRDFARPTVHARNLYHVSCAMWDAWAAYEPSATQMFHNETQTADDIPAAQAEAISFAAYRVLRHRFLFSPGAFETIPYIDDLMDNLGYDRNNTSTTGDTPAALGNRIAADIIAAGLNDNSNEQFGYANFHYAPVNEALLPDFPGNPDLTHPNRWQPLALKWFKDQGGNIVVGGYPDFLSPEWGQVHSFALSNDDRTIYNRDGFDYWVFHDPGAPPMHNGDGDDYYRVGHTMVSIWSGHLDPFDGVEWDISPRVNGNSPLPDSDDWETYYDLFNGGDWGIGREINPHTGQPYEHNFVPRGDYARVLAEFWADGPSSETPPGHWFSILNYVADHPAFEKRFGGQGPLMDETEWYLKAYLLMGGAMHDVAITAWGCKGWYDYIRPISAIRYMADQGQSSDIGGPSYHPDGIPLFPGWVEVVTADTTGPKQRHEHLAGHEGKIAVYAWRGHDYIVNPDVDQAGVGWILAENWWPYQRPSFVTPPFAGYVSGHSTYSRGAADLMTLLTGSPFFPGGMGEFFCPQNEFLVFEEGPSVDVTLQWATYQDASDQTSLSRIWGGIHPPADDIPGRHMGEAVAEDAWNFALSLYGNPCYADYNGDTLVNTQDFTDFLNDFTAVMGGGDPTHGNPDYETPAEVINSADFVAFLNLYVKGCN